MSGAGGGGPGREDSHAAHLLPQVTPAAAAVATTRYGAAASAVYAPRGGARHDLVVTDNDVLSGRGVMVSSHKGNHRFRKLVSSHYDDNYCTSYSTIEKRAVADKIIAHIQALDPPGRFLKNVGRGRSSKLSGPWEELTYQEALKKTIQALRDANRDDRSGYAQSVPVPEDVRQHRGRIEQQGLTNRQFARKAAAEILAKSKLASPLPSLKQERTPSTRSATARQPLPSPHLSSSTSTTTWMGSRRSQAGPEHPLPLLIPRVTPATAARAAPPLLDLSDDDRRLPARDSLFPLDDTPPSPAASDDVPHAFQDSPQLGDGDPHHHHHHPHDDPLYAMAVQAAVGLEDPDASGHHHPHDAGDYPGLFPDDDVEISAETAFEEP